MPVDTKTALLDSAERAARHRGFDAFSYADLSKDVGIRKASIHYHFPSKADLAVALMKRYHDVTKAACHAIDEQHDTGANRLRALIAHYRAALGNGKSLCLCVSFVAARESLPAEVTQEIHAFHQTVLAWLGGTFALGQTDGSISWVADPNQEAAAMLPLLEGAQLSARAEEDATVFDTALRLMQTRFS